VPTLDTVTLGAASVATVTVGAGARASVATAVPGSSISHSACAVNDERPSSRAVARITFMISPNELPRPKRYHVGHRSVCGNHSRSDLFFAAPGAPSSAKGGRQGAHLPPRVQATPLGRVARQRPAWAIVAPAELPARPAAPPSPPHQFPLLRLKPNKGRTE
jgi:hypothetical protein